MRLACDRWLKKDKEIMKQSEGLKKLDEFSLHRGRRPKSTFVPASQAPPAKKVRYHIDLSIDTDSD